MEFLRLINDFDEWHKLVNGVREQRLNLLDDFEAENILSSNGFKI